MAFYDVAANLKTANPVKAFQEGKAMAIARRNAEAQEQRLEDQNRRADEQNRRADEELDMRRQGLENETARLAKERELAHSALAR